MSTLTEKEGLLILAIETSCDETSAAIVKNGRTVLSNIIHSQIALHETYGGVVPEIASRSHIEKINEVIEKALAQAQVSLHEIDIIAVTYGPGLVGALLVGVSQAKAIAYALDKPLIPIHHIEGHIAANFLEHKQLRPPFLSLVVSGGHTHLIAVKDYGKFEILGQTRDDAAGEAFDKIARAIGFGYPGGPKIENEAKKGNPYAIPFPKAKVENAPYDFSFSGLKSAVLNYLHKAKQRGENVNLSDLAASFQQAVIDALIEKTALVIEKYSYSTLVLAGGVAANRSLVFQLRKWCEEHRIKFFAPSLVYCTDNAAMIAAAAYDEYRQGNRSNYTLNAVPNLKIGERKYEQW
ncbi:tRNA N6-adenosine threonylcarbamoyltransferase [Clostridia bacterium]|nr:tRNA N6-adenosine threonylcarbamoyltransferase [Clostridia bacterium]